NRMKTTSSTRCLSAHNADITGPESWDRIYATLTDSTLVIMVGLAIDQIAQPGLSSLKVIYYLAQLFRFLSNCKYTHYPVSCLFVEEEG
ncbi:hypothetical protein PTR77_25815, partial [Serratia bockelmannii]|uniref:hypothetical protein n=1 Tax=Serratia bockelmannii TaxID=2703793 RepID=UPI00313D5D77